MQVSKDIWSYLNLNVQGEAQTIFNNVPSLNGFEAWRRIVVPLGSRTQARKNELHSKIHSPVRAKKLSEVLMRGNVT